MGLILYGPSLHALQKTVSLCLFKPLETVVLFGDFRKSVLLWAVAQTSNYSIKLAIKLYFKLTNVKIYKQDHCFLKAFKTCKVKYRVGNLSCAPKVNKLLNLI